MGKKIIVFLDNIGRIVIGSVKTETDTHISLEDPALVHINVNSQSSQLQLQLLPLFFKEFVKDRSIPTVWHFNKQNITLTENIDFADQFLTQYLQMSAPPSVSVPPPTIKQKEKTENIVRLFDEEKKD